MRIPPSSSLSKMPSRVAAALLVIAITSSAKSTEAGDGTNPPAPVAATKPADLAALEAAWKANPVDLAAGMQLEDALLAAGKDVYAADLFRRAAESGKSPAVASYLWGRAMHGAKGATLMRAALERRCDLPPGNDAGAGIDDAWRALIDAETSDRLFADAAKDGETLARRTEDAGDWAVLGRLLERAKDPAAARAAYEHALAKDPLERAARDGLALLLARSGDVDGAIRLAKETTVKFPASATAWIRLGMVYGAARKATDARQAYAAAFLRAQDDARALLVLGATFTGIEDYALAHKSLDRALVLAPNDPDTLAAAGALLLQEDKAGAALPLLARAAAASPKDARLAFLQGVAAERVLDYAGAVSAYARAAKLSPQDAEYATALGLVLETKGDTDGAIQAFKDAMEAAPDDPDLPLRLGGLCEKKRRWRQAEEAYRAAAKLAPKKPEPHLFLAVVLGDHLDNDRAALEELETYRLLGGAEPAALRWLAQLKNPKGK